MFPGFVHDKFRNEAPLELEGCFQRSLTVTLGRRRRCSVADSRCAATFAWVHQALLGLLFTVYANSRRQATLLGPETHFSGRQGVRSAATTQNAACRFCEASCTLQEQSARRTQASWVASRGSEDPKSLRGAVGVPDSTGERWQRS